MKKYRCPSLEAQIANLADEITYYSHDLDDAVDFEILSPRSWKRPRSGRQAMSRSRTVIRRCASRSCTSSSFATSSMCRCGMWSRPARRRSRRPESRSADEVRRQPSPLICYSEELLEANRELRRFLYQNVYYHPRVAEVNQRACEMLRVVFEAYCWRRTAGGGGDATNRERRPASDGVRLHRRHDRSLPLRRAHAAQKRVGGVRRRRSRSPRADIGSRAGGAD